MKNTNEMNGKYLISILADVSSNTLYIPKAIKEKSRYLSSPEATLYFEYKNRYPSFTETII